MSSNACGGWSRISARTGLVQSKPPRGRWQCLAHRPGRNSSEQAERGPWRGPYRPDRWGSRPIYNPQGGGCQLLTGAPGLVFRGHESLGRSAPRGVDSHWLSGSRSPGLRLRPHQPGRSNMKSALKNITSNEHRNPNGLMKKELNTLTRYLITPSTH